MEISVGLGSKKLLLKRGTYKSQEPPVSSERAPRESEQLLVFTGKACLCSKYVPLLLCCALFQQRERIVLSQNAPLPFLPFSSVSWPSLLDLLGWVYYGGLNSKLRQWQRFIVGRNQTSSPGDASSLKNLPVQLALLVDELVILFSMETL